MKQIYFKLLFLAIFAFAIGQGQAQSSLDSALIAHYPFNSNALDASGNDHHGVVNGATLTDDRFGQAFSAYYFDGVDDVIKLDSLTGTLQDFTVSAWVQVASLTNQSDDFAQVFRRPYMAIKRSTGKVGVNTSGINNVNGDSYYYSNSVIQPGQWVLITSTYDQTFGRYAIYLNGQLDMAMSNKFGSGELLMIEIGGEPLYASGRYFNGKLDDIRIYERALADQEILELYNETFTDIEDLLPAGSLTIYPNPTQGNLTVSCHQSRVEAVELYDLTGRLLKTDWQLQGSKAQLATDFKGMAILKVRTEKGIATHKVYYR